VTQIDSSVKQKRVAEALLQMAQQSPQELGPYLSKRLTTHVAQANLWNQLAAAADVLDAVDLESLVSDVLANTFGTRELPLPIAATITVRHLIASNHPQARASYRIFGQAQLAGFARAGSASADLEIGAINWAWRFRRDSVTIPLSGHTRPVTALASVGLAGGRTLLASGDSDGALRLWDPATGASAGDPLTGHSLALAALATIGLPGEHTLLVSSGWDGTVRLWNPATGTQTGQLRTGDIGQVRAVTAVDAPRWAHLARHRRLRRRGTVVGTSNRSSSQKASHEASWPRESTDDFQPVGAHLPCLRRRRRHGVVVGGDR